MSLQSFVPNFKIQFQVVPEKSLTEKQFTHTHTDTQTLLQKRQKLYTPLYTSYTGGINIKTFEIFEEKEKTNQKNFNRKKVIKDHLKARHSLNQRAYTQRSTD